MVNFKMDKIILYFRTPFLIMIKLNGLSYFLLIISWETNFDDIFGWENYSRELGYHSREIRYVENGMIHKDASEPENALKAQNFFFIIL